MFIHLNKKGKHCPKQKRSMRSGWTAGKVVGGYVSQRRVMMAEGRSMVKGCRSPLRAAQEFVILQVMFIVRLLLQMNKINIICQFVHLLLQMNKMNKIIRVLHICPFVHL